MPPSSPVRAVILTNIPAPYRIPVYERIDASPDIDLTVLYTAARERNRHWTIPPTSVRTRVLRSFVLDLRGKYVHITRGVWRALDGIGPDVIVTTGFNPPQLEAIVFCIVRRVPHVIQTDGTIESERVLTRAHRAVRRFTARRSQAFVAASESGLALMRSWGADPGRFHRSPLAINNGRFRAPVGHERAIDMLFSGQLSEIKDPLFALEVARRASERLGRRLHIAFIGEGPLRAALETRSLELRDEVQVTIAGFQQQDSLPDWYRSSRVFLFPTHWDPWGLVSNEAAAAGTPQIVSPNAGAARELIRSGVNGWVEPLDPATWTDRVVELLRDDRHWSEMSEAAEKSVQRYTFEAAAGGLADAMREAAGRSPVHERPAAQS